MSRPFRYTFILALVALGTCLAAVSGWRYARASAPVNGPIILLSVDSLRADRLPVYGYQNVQTPAIDALAADGVVFDRAFAHVPQTLSAHATILTGRLPFDTGVRDSVGSTIGSSERLISEMLRDRGYSTAGVVSSFLLRSASGIDQGFSFFDAELPSAESPAGLLKRGASASARVAEAWLDSVGTTRAFLFLHLGDLHTPRLAGDGEAQRASYEAGIEQIDAAIGELITYLKKHQLYDQSTVILVADHGEGLGDHGEQAHGLLVYDNVLHVPLIIKLPASEASGRRVKSLVQQIDLVPTILDLAKAPFPDNLRGRSLMPVIDGETRSPALAYGESMFARLHFGWSDLVTITDGRYRYISGAGDELYDLEHDPAERENIAAAHQDIAETLRKALNELAAAPGPRPLDEVADEDRERFEALGYVGTLSSHTAGPVEMTDPKDWAAVVDRYRAAVTLERSGDLKGAIEQYDELARREPALRDVWMHLGRTALRADRVDVALDAFSRAAPLAPGDAAAALEASAAALRLRRYDEAVRHANQVIESGSADLSSQADAHERLARVAIARRSSAAARSEAALAEAADASRPVRAYVEGRLLFDQQKWVAALEHFDAALSQVTAASRPLADLRLCAAEAMIKVERFAEAEYLLGEELKAAPLNARARSGMAALYRATARGNEARTLAQQ